MEADSVDSIVTDPPYGLKFMGKKWDHSVPSVEIFEQCLRVLKPGGHLLAFAGTRTQHRMAVNIEDAGFEIRDMIAWVYGTGFPKSQNVGKAIDKAAGAVREVIGPGKYANRGRKTESNVSMCVSQSADDVITAPATPEAQQWDGWGTALKPALEPITVARKPFKGTVTGNVLEHGTGAINIDGCRVESDGSHKRCFQPTNNERSVYGKQAGFMPSNKEGRWPANLIHDGSDEVINAFPYVKSSGRAQTRENMNHAGGGTAIYGSGLGGPSFRYGDAGGSGARFFYCPKANKKDRGEGNNHPTVKPTNLMAYLVRLVTPPGGVVLDPFMGSGSTGKACKREGFDFIGCDLDPDFVELARKRIEEA